MPPVRLPSITLIGGGLVGTLLARQLAQRGFAVTIHEKRADPRRSGAERGRSINLALAERGLQALRSADVAQDVLQQAVMMRGRMVHASDGSSTLQRYGVDDSEVIWSVSRATLNTLLLDAAEDAGVKLHFGQSLGQVDFDRRRLQLTDSDGVTRETDFELLLGADGAGSAVRAAMHAHRPLGERVAWLGHGYKELEIPPASKLSGDAATSAAAHGRFALEPHALHIWPRGGYMCIALPNTEGSFTVTLFLPNQPSQQPSFAEPSTGASFAELESASAAGAFFASQFPDLLRLMPQFAHDYASHPVGTLATLYLDRWHLDGRAVLLGDAAHAIVPFHGQGMNCGFEDTVVLADLLAAAPQDSAAVFAEFQRRRQPNAQAIAQMAIENYEEMRHAVTDPHYLARRALGAQMEARVPDHFMSRYRMVSFTHLPYAYALERGRAQDAVLTECLRSSSASTGADLAGMDLASIDLDALAQRCRDVLPPLPPLRHA